MGFIRYFDKHDPEFRQERPDLIEYGFISRLLPFVQEQTKALILPFEQFLDTQRYGVEGEKISWGKLARHIPVEGEYHDAEQKHEAQKNRLKNWRASKYYPSKKIIERFFMSLSGQSDIGSALDLATAAIGLDRLVASDLKEFGNSKGVDAMAVIEEGYAMYPLYWAKYKALYLDAF